MNGTLAKVVTEAFERHAPLTALAVDDIRLSYGELHSSAKSISRALSESGTEGAVGIFANRTTVRYTAIAAAVISGRTYVPLNPDFPTDRTTRMLALSGCQVVIVCPDSVNDFVQLVTPVEDTLTVVLPDNASENATTDIRNAGCQVVMAESSGTCPLEEVPGAELEHAYVLFTSGSTGQPKGIGVTPTNLLAYLNHALDAYGLDPGDRATQMFEFTFDLSVHDLFVTWLSGAELWVPTRAQLFSPSTFISANEITHWFSVPSVLSVMKRLRSLEPGSYPTLKQSLFCGEALPGWAADAWHEAAPSSSIYNLYGPTEATIAVTAYQCHFPADESDRSPSASTVPIGKPFPNHRAKLIHEGREVANGEIGELLISGPQVTPGYIGNEEKTRAAFVTLGNDCSEILYRTGDLVRQDADGCLHFVGRVDSQVQLRGHRVELKEIEDTIRLAPSAASSVAVVPLTDSEGLVTGVAAFVESGDTTAGDSITAEIRKVCKEKLPDYMAPSKIVLISRFPLNSNGKTDRSELQKIANSEK